MAPRSHSGLEYLDSKTIKFRSKKYLFISILKTASVNICQKMRQYLKLVLICCNNVGDHDLWVFQKLVSFKARNTRSCLGGGKHKGNPDSRAVQASCLKMKKYGIFFGRFANFGNIHSYLEWLEMWPSCLDYWHHYQVWFYPVVGLKVLNTGNAIPCMIQSGCMIIRHQACSDSLVRFRRPSIQRKPGTGLSLQSQPGNASQALMSFRQYSTQILIEADRQTD